MAPSIAFFKVVSRTPVCVNHGNGSVVSYPRGSIFQADPQLPDVRRLLQLVPSKLARTSVVAGAIPQPGPNFPLPAEKPPIKNLNLPGGIHELVRSPGL